MNAQMKLSLCLIACMLAIAPGCTKRSDNLTRSERLEADHKKYENRGIALIVAGPVTTIIGPVLVFAGAAALIPGGTIPGAITTGAGIYMIGQGLHDLAKAKRLRRLQRKEAELQRKLEREATAQQS